MDPWREFLENLSKWLKYTCYLAFVWVFLDIIRFFPPHIADRIIEGVLRKLGL